MTAIQETPGPTSFHQMALTKQTLRDLHDGIPFVSRRRPSNSPNQETLALDL